MTEKSYTYIVQCVDGSFYAGWTLDLDRRLQEHNDGTSKTKYTRTRRPVKLVYFEEFDTRAKAAQREWQIKELRREDKIKLIQIKHPRVYRLTYYIYVVGCFHEINIYTKRIRQTSNIPKQNEQGVWRNCLCRNQ